MEVLVLILKINMSLGHPKECVIDKLYILQHLQQHCKPFHCNCGYRCNNTLEHHCGTYIHFKGQRALDTSALSNHEEDNRAPLSTHTSSS